ncbi:SNX11 protein, partial [Aegithalos caudatus]|nr:SNX11 protein [Aegithalos caudatus]
LGSGSRMLENREEELTTVRVQDPRVHNEGSWNSYVDYRIFLHVSRGRGEVVQSRLHLFLQSGRVAVQVTAEVTDVPVCPQGGAEPPAPVPAEREVTGVTGWQQGWQYRVVQSRLHLFLQTQLPVAAIEACVQGRGPLSVTEAILQHAL